MNFHLFLNAVLFSFSAYNCIKDTGMFLVFDNIIDVPKLRNTNLRANGQFILKMADDIVPFIKKSVHLVSMI